MTTGRLIVAGVARVGGTLVAAGLAGAVLAGAAVAQTSVANPPGNTLAPQTGAVAVTTGPAPTASGGDLAHAATAQAAAEKYRTELVCKTQVQTGSLIAKKKTCLTRSQWQYVNDENQRDAYKFVQDNTTKSGGP